jgi:hypothetical protein
MNDMQRLENIQKKLGFLDCCLELTKFERQKLDGFWGLFGLVKWNDLQKFSRDLVEKVHARYPY